MSKKTTIYLPDELYNRAHDHAIHDNVSVTSLIVEGLNMVLNKSAIHNIDDAIHTSIEPVIPIEASTKPTTFGAAEFPICEMEDYDFCAEQDSSKIDFRVVDSTGFALWRWNQENNRYEPNTKGLQHMLFYKWRRNHPDTKKVVSSSKAFNSKVMLPIKHEPVEMSKSLTDLDNLLASVLSKSRNADEVDC